MFNIRITLLLLLLASLTACGGGGGGGSGDTTGNSGSSSGSSSGSNSPMILSGILVDSLVQGVNYTTATESGTTDAQGTFNYLSGEDITFSIGDVAFPTIAAKSTITPFDLAGTLDVNDTALINMARLLQTLDVDGDVSNGITVDDAAHLAATGASISFTSLTFDTDTDVVNLVSNSGSVNGALIDGTTAINNLVTYVNPDTGCTRLHSTIGYQATLIQRSNGVSGQATIIDDCTIQLSSLNYDGGGLPDVSIYAGLGENYAAGFSISNNLFGTPLNNINLTVTLPEDRTLDDLDGISVWCAIVGTSFGDGLFTSP